MLPSAHPVLRVLRRSLFLAPLLLLAAHPSSPDPLSGLVWRNLGPFRGGRVSAVTGAIGRPGTFYAGYPAADAICDFTVRIEPDKPWRR